MKNIKNRKGQSIVELTLITPLLLVALYVPFDFGIALWTASLSQNAVRDVARKAANQDGAAFDATALQAEIIANTPAYVRSSATATVIRRTTNPADCMQYVQASVTYTYPYAWYRMARLFGLTVPANTSVTRTARMRYEFQPDSNGGAAATPCTAA